MLTYYIFDQQFIILCAKTASTIMFLMLVVHGN